MNSASDDAQPTVNDLPGLVVNRIFHSLGPRDLAVASSVCRGWREHGVDALTDRWALRSLVTMPCIVRSAVCSLRCTVAAHNAQTPPQVPQAHFLTAGHRGTSGLSIVFPRRLWKGHYMERWRPRTSQTAERWQVSYADKLRQLHSYRGRAQQDRVCGHAGGVKAVGLLPAHNLLATGQSYVTDFCQRNVLPRCRTLITSHSAQMPAVPSPGRIPNGASMHGNAHRQHWQRHSLCAIRLAGSTDRTVRLWDLQAGLPLASTRRLGGIVRGIAIDEELLVAATSQVGCS